MKCPNCGRAMASNQRFCGSCGANCTQRQAIPRRRTHPVRKAAAFLAMFIAAGVAIAGVVQGHLGAVMAATLIFGVSLSSLGD